MAQDLGCSRHLRNGLNQLHRPLRLNVERLFQYRNRHRITNLRLHSLTGGARYDLDFRRTIG